MAFRDPQPLALSRQAVLLVTAVGVGLIALSYVLGVQVGKGSASLRRPDAKSVDEQLKELPEPLLDQLKLFQPGDGPPDARGLDTPKPAEGMVEAKPETKAETKADPGPGTERRPVPGPESKTEAKAPAKTEAKPDNKPEARAEAGERWTLQLVATKDPAEAKKVAEKAKAAGFATTTAKEGGQVKVRLAKPTDRATADKAADKLKKAGLKTFPVKAE